MKRTLYLAFVVLAMLLPLLTACGAPAATAQQEPPTPPSDIEED